VVRKFDVLHLQPWVRWLKQYKAQGNAHPNKQNGVGQPLQHVPEDMQDNIK
jgi:hypothetical protein